MIANAASQSVVPENLLLTSKGFERLFMKYIMPLLPMSRTPEQAAANSVFVAVNPSTAKPGGQYFEDKKPIKSSDASYDEAVAKKLWEVSAELTGLHRDRPAS